MLSPNPVIEDLLLKVFENPMCARLFHVLFAFPIMLFEEGLFAYLALQRSRRLLGLTPYIRILKTETSFGSCSNKMLTRFDDIPATGDIPILTKEQVKAAHSLCSCKPPDEAELAPSFNFECVNVRHELTVWYTYIWDDIKRKLQLVLMQNSIQFSYQAAKVLIVFLYPNLLDARYTSSYMMFRFISAVTIFSIALSVFSIFTPVLNRECVLSCIKRKRVPNALLYVVKCLQLIVHLTLSTGSVFLLGSSS